MFLCESKLIIGKHNTILISFSMIWIYLIWARAPKIGNIPESQDLVYSETCVGAL